jgi:hypothetical protein
MVFRFLYIGKQHLVRGDVDDNRAFQERRQGI